MSHLSSTVNTVRSDLDIELGVGMERARGRCQVRPGLLGGTAMRRHVRATNFAILSDVEIELGVGMNVLAGDNEPAPNVWLEELRC